MVIDAHAEVGPFVKDSLKRKKIGAHPEGTVEAYLRDMDGAGIDMGVTFGRLDLDNQYQAKIQKLYPDRIISCAYINPRAENAKEELLKCAEEYGLRGLKLNGFRHCFSSADHELLDPLLEICAAHKMPVIMHSAGDNCFTTPMQIEEMARSFPDVIFIMAHGGNLWLAEEGTLAGARTKNIIVDASAMEAFRITHNAKVIPKGNFVMGSGWPWNNLKAVKFNIERCIQDPAVLEWVLGRAIAEAFGIY